MNKLFEKAWEIYRDNRIAGRHAVFFEPEKDAFYAGWQAAKAEMRQPQTAETCQAVPPHPRSNLVRKQHKHTEHCPGDCEGYIESCLVCEAVRQAVDETLAKCDAKVQELAARKEYK